MQVTRTRHDSWTMPRACCACGEAAEGTDKYAASCVVDRSTAGNTTTTTSLKLEFPMCSPCHKASVRSSTSMVAGILLGFVAGYFALTLFVDTSKNVTGWEPLVGGLAALIGGAVFFGWLGYYVWGRIAGPDQRRRAKLTTTPVKLSIVPPASLQFEFSNERFGEAFTLLNP